jgi:hypothetical protein
MFVMSVLRNTSQKHCCQLSTSGDTGLSTTQSCGSLFAPEGLHHRSQECVTLLKMLVSEQSLGIFMGGCLLRTGISGPWTHWTGLTVSKIRLSLRLGNLPRQKWRDALNVAAERMLEAKKMADKMCEAVMKSAEEKRETSGGAPWLSCMRLRRPRIREEVVIRQIKSDELEDERPRYEGLILWDGANKEKSLS